MLSRYSLLALPMARFNSFLSLLQFFLLSLLFTFFHFLHSAILLITSCVIHGFVAFLSTYLFESLTVSSTHLLILFLHMYNSLPSIFDNLYSMIYMSSTLYFLEEGCSLLSKYIDALKPLCNELGKILCERTTLVS